MTFRPTLWATVAAAAALMILIGLGTWQLDRRAWKNDLIETRQQRLHSPAVLLADIAMPKSTNIGTLEYRPIRLHGRYRADADIKLLNRTRGGRAGFHVVTPFMPAGGGTAVLVDRGWAPIGEAGSKFALPAETIVIDGYIRRFAAPGRFTPKNDPGAGEWFYLDAKQVAVSHSLPSVLPFYVQLAPGSGGEALYPAASVPEIALRNPHLQYALTWYALAVALAVIYVVFHMRRRAGEDNQSNLR